jgi:hypothetical protein
MANPLLLYQLESYFIDTPKQFAETVNGSSYLSKLYDNIIGSFSNDTAKVYSSVSLSTLIQLDMDGNLLFSDETAKFADTKEGVKEIPGGAEKMAGGEITIADAINKRALIIRPSTIDFTTSALNFYYDNPTLEDRIFINLIFSNVSTSTYVNVSATLWRYNSSKYITAFSVLPSENQIINVRDDGIENDLLNIRQNTTVTWVNCSSKPISIYSGTATYDQVLQDPDLNLYGKEFKSPVLQVGESWSYKFVSVNDNSYFVYPDVLTGRVNVVEYRINTSDTFIIAENDGLNTPFSSRIIKLDCYGNVLWDFGNSYLIQPRRSKPLLSGNTLVSV